MSILKSVEAVPTRMRDIFNFVATSPQLSNKETLRSLFMPENSRSGGTLVLDVPLRECLKLGLLEGDGDFRVSNFAAQIKENDFESLVYEVLFNMESAKKLEQVEFLHSLAWLMTFDPGEPVNFSHEIAGKLDKSLGKNVGLTDLAGGKETYANLLYWAVFLGFGEFYGASSEGRSSRLFMVNPTNIIRSKIQAIFAENDRLVITDFIDLVGNIIPVLDRGEAREAIERNLDKNYRIPENHISKALSLALKQLDHEKLIKLERHSDAESMSLDFGGMGQKESVSGVLLRQ